MKKFNEFEKYLVSEGLKLFSEQMRADVKAYENSGKMPLYTVSYVDMVERELLEKLNDMTKKQK
jgi:hypothetical protein